ncbi:MAG TPA: hypothetical protein VK427_05495, partial [Kofleriaceae bacterium]|nr:hypothetical protein [Kofleriaceae bacterium]
MGTFEAHITVDATTAERRAAFAAACRELGVKCVLIELARGAHASQPMTSSHHTGELASVMREIMALRAHLEAAGFAVTRVKVEEDAGDDDVPVDAAGPPGTYFEFHGKLALGPDDDLTGVRATCEAIGAHLSHNDFERGVSRFVTLRVYDAGRTAAQARFADVLRTLTAAGHLVTNCKAE